MAKFLVHNSDKLALRGVDLSELLAGCACEVLQVGKHSVLLLNDSPYKEDGDPDRIWVRKENGEFLKEEKGMEELLKNLEEKLTEQFSPFVVMMFLGFVKTQPNILRKLELDFDAGVLHCVEVIKEAQQISPRIIV